MNRLDMLLKELNIEFENSINNLQRKVYYG